MATALLLQPSGTASQLPSGRPPLHWEDEEEEEEERERRREEKNESPQKCLHNRKRLIKYLWFGMCDSTGQTMHLAGNPAINAAALVFWWSGGWRGGRTGDLGCRNPPLGPGQGGTCPLCLTHPVVRELQHRRDAVSQAEPCPRQEPGFSTQTRAPAAPDPGVSPCPGWVSAPRPPPAAIAGALPRSRRVLTAGGEGLNPEP